MFWFLTRSRIEQSKALPTKPSTSYTAVTHPDLPPPEELDPYLAKNQKFLLPIYNRPPIVLLDGKGMYVNDSHGRKYLDFSGGIAVNALGHADDGLADVRAERQIFAFCFEIHHCV